MCLQDLLVRAQRESGDWQGVKEWRGQGEKTKQGNKEQVMATNLVYQEQELDDSSTAFMLTVALHTRTAEA